jgi:predicted nucleotidyltransferase
MRTLIEIQDFVECLTSYQISYTLALTGSLARGEARNNLGRHDYKSDIDILCIIAPKDIAKTIFLKKKFFRPIPLILMNSEALDHPSNAVLSIAFDSLINNGLNLSKPVFTDKSALEFFAYQLQPLAYYRSRLYNSTSQEKRRLYSKIATTCLKLLYLIDQPDHRSFVYEYELNSHHFVNVDEILVRDIVNRALPDEQLRLTTEWLEARVAECSLISKSSDFLASTNLYLLDRYIYSKEIIEAVFLENNRLSRSDSLFFKGCLDD